MTPLFQIAAFAWREERAALWRGLLLSVAVLAAGGLLLGLSGWFITAAGMAGVAGIGIAFDVFRPSAGVRFLALGRTAARYGERVLTHDATLRVLARVRVRILARLSERSPDALARLRSPALLNRVMSDVDALDGVAIRLVFPVIAGVVTLGLAATLLSWLVSPLVTALVVGVLSLGGAATMAVLGRKSVTPAAQAEAARQALRSATVEHLRARIALAFSGALGRSRQSLLTVDADLRRAELRLAELEAQAAATVSLSGIFAASGALLLGGTLALRGDISAPQAAIGVFAALALVEVIAPAQRAVAEIGRMRNAAGRVAPMLGAAPTGTVRKVTNAAPAPSSATMLELRNVTFTAPGSATPLTAPVTLSVRAGEMAAVIGRSGAGKSTLLSLIAGLATQHTGSIKIAGRSSHTLEERDLRAALGYLPQRSRFISGTIRDNLALAAPQATSVEMAEVLAALGLRDALAARGGLDMPLGEGGSGLSGGESRRLALARVLLRRPRILLLDEPTESLDAATAARVLRAIKSLLPDAAILIATHKPEERNACDTVCDLNYKN